MMLKNMKNHKRISGQTILDLLRKRLMNESRSSIQKTNQVIKIVVFTRMRDM